MADETSGPKLHIDSDWKAEAQKEKERLAKKEQAKATAPASSSAASSPKTSKSAPAAAGGAEAHPGELPEPSFRALIGMLASQAIMGLGAMTDPQTNRVVIDLEGARFSIDLLDVLDQKTKGNLTEDEAKELKQLLVELRNRYVQIATFVAKQMAAQQQNPQSPGTPVPGTILQ